MTNRIHFFLDWNEYFAAQEFFRRSRQSFLPDWGFGALLILLGLVLLFVSGLDALAAAALLVGLVVVSGAPWVRRWASKRKWRREPLYQTEHEVTFGIEGVYFRMGQIESNLDWRYYQRLMENPDGFLLVYGDD